MSQPAHRATKTYRWTRLRIPAESDHRFRRKVIGDSGGYAGRTVAVVDRESAEICQAEVFVVVLGASNYTFAEWEGGLLHGRAPSSPRTDVRGDDGFPRTHLITS